VIQHGQVFKLKTRGADGQPLWAYRYRLEGRSSERPQVGGFASRAEAEKALRKVLDRLGPGGGRATITLGEFVDEYLEVHQAAPMTIAKLRWLLGKATSVLEPAAKIAYGRHRGEGSRPSGNTNATASGQAKKAGQSEETSAAQEPPGRAPGCASSATHAYGVAASTAASDSAPTKRIHPIGLRGRCAEINAPTAAGAEIAAKSNGYNQTVPVPGTCCAAAIPSRTSPPAIRATAASAKLQATRRSAVRTPSFSLSGAPLATVLAPNSICL